MKHSQGTYQHCDICSKPNTYIADTKKHMDNIHCGPGATYQNYDFGNEQTPFGADIKNHIENMHIPGTFAILVVNQILPLQILRHMSNLYIVRLPIKTVTVVANQIYMVQI